MLDVPFNQFLLAYAQVTEFPKRTQDITIALESSHTPFPN